MFNIEYRNFSILEIVENNISNSTSSFSNQDFSDVLQIVLLKYCRPPVLIFGIFGNILNLIVLFKHKSRRTRSAISFLTALSIMDLFLLFFQSSFIFLEWMKTILLQLSTIAVYYRCYIRYWNSKWNLKLKYIYKFK